MLHESKTCGIDGTGIFEWDTGLLLYLWIPELGSGLVPLGLITVMATEHEVGDPIRATPTLGKHMIDLEGNLSLIAVDTASAELLQQIGSAFPSSQLAMLVGDPFDLRVLHKRQIELDLLDLYACER
jgi:hypothetical protein